mmetsp:Transcript_161105/g.517087  ORF Transcript_161105/g.517087 Transcript_161105/m.517087 type:complete len:239 (-) Transcript_161105:181-897(-)
MLKRSPRSPPRSRPPRERCVLAPPPRLLGVGPSFEPKDGAESMTALSSSCAETSASTSGTAPGRQRKARSAEKRAAPGAGQIALQFPSSCGSSTAAFLTTSRTATTFGAATFTSSTTTGGGSSTLRSTFLATGFLLTVFLVAVAFSCHSSSSQPSSSSSSLASDSASDSLSSSLCCTTTSSSSFFSSTSSTASCVTSGNDWAPPLAGIHAADHWPHTPVAGALGSLGPAGGEGQLVRL